MCSATQRLCSACIHARLATGTCAHTWPPDELKPDLAFLAAAAPPPPPAPGSVIITISRLRAPAASDRSEAHAETSGSRAIPINTASSSLSNSGVPHCHSQGQRNSGTACVGPRSHVFQASQEGQRPFFCCVVSPQLLHLNSSLAFPLPVPGRARGASMCARPSEGGAADSTQPICAAARL